MLWLGPDSRGRQPLISEAVRGEGAVLVDAAGRQAHDRPASAGRPGPARRRGEGDHARDDRRPAPTTCSWTARHLGAEIWEHRFPTILASCREHGIDPVTELIPVVPAAHYASGGVRTDLHGRTSVPGLYACGEAACTGVHGANRLASNSLLEGLVFAERIAAALARGLPPAAAAAPPMAGRPGCWTPRSSGRSSS